MAFYIFGKRRDTALSVPKIIIQLPKLTKLWHIAHGRGENGC